ncbi:stage II sporulation protein M [Calderihabitans maritimus]|uniref:Stage II sporulation protein M n=1 Tax=Calderihabitans maritimus TaxID=1246530 RepID=A0A1Z5HQ73_9FIRM|nr:stage II sporulation protein M [Calderihabitans maritimus]GAW91679.1 stage II sporulation protein M [Calderihabitans maritimus]
MIRKLRGRLAEHFRANLLLMGIITLCFIGGIVYGSFTVSNLAPVEKGELREYVESFLKSFKDMNVNTALLARKAVLMNLKTLFYIWFLGLTVVGVPLILFTVFMRGFILGFTVAFLVREQAVAGVLLTILSLLPQNLLFIPSLLVGATTALSFSLLLVRGRRARETVGLPRRLAVYTGLMLILTSAGFLAGLIEAYISPAGIKLISLYLF